MKILIQNYEDLRDFVNRDYITVQNAYKVVTAYIDPIIIFTDGSDPYTTKEQLLFDLEHYIKLEEETGIKPLFFNQKKPDFSIKDVF